MTITFDYTYMNRLVKASWMTNQNDNAELCVVLMAADDDPTVPQGNPALNTLEEEWDTTFGPYTVPSTGETFDIQMLREGVERFLITDINNPAGSASAQSEVVVAWDQAGIDGLYSQQFDMRFNHVPGGSNILYMDGHVAFVKYGVEHTQATWPLSKVSIDKKTHPYGAEGIW
ncbi:MAG: hypothetical protein HUU46_23160 [Candidatus Hydrogenedentes bacterium]|nr:hypothetical protein [Candidatus Hydrogenedentota bacterium]